MPRLYLLLSLLIVSSASAVTMDWTPIGNAGNAADTAVMTCCASSTGTTGYGSVGYGYFIGTYEVTNAQYVEFLNAKAASDPLGLYNTAMGDPSPGVYGGITRTGSSGSYAYGAIVGRGDMPVGFLSYYDALRFANWMNNGQGSGDTETGAYTLTGGTAIPANGETVTRNPGAQIVLSNENEWYKAAYYDSSTASYFTFPTGSNTEPVCSGPTGTANRANCQYAAGDLTAVGSYTGSPSPYGTFDQGGNGYEWNEAMIPCNLSGPCFDVYRGVRGGGLDGGSQSLAATIRSEANPANEGRTFGLRLVMIPEPSTGLLVTFGLLGLGARRRISA